MRFRQEWRIADHASDFFFPGDANWTSLTEVRLNDRHGNQAGNIDVVLVSYDKHGQILDFGALEVQAVYITGNIRRPFEYFMSDPGSNKNMDWAGQPNYPRPDYLSSSRKRLAPQLLFKGGIINAWGKKTAVAVNTRFFETLPKFSSVDKNEADIAWLVYDLLLDKKRNCYDLELQRITYSRFTTSLDAITRSVPGDQSEFIAKLQDKLDEKLDDEDPPETPTLNMLL